MQLYMNGLHKYANMFQDLEKKVFWLTYVEKRPTRFQWFCLLEYCVVIYWSYSSSCLSQNGGPIKRFLCARGELEQNEEDEKFKLVWVEKNVVFFSQYNIVFFWVSQSSMLPMILTRVDFVRALRPIDGQYSISSYHFIAWRALQI